MSTVIVNGTIHADVNFVDSLEKADIEVVYDKTSYDKDNNNWLYFRYGYLVAVAGGVG